MEIDTHMISLTSEKRHVRKCATDSVIITGQCGTGKTYILRCIIKSLEQKWKRVAITSTTGISCTHLGVGASTLHHWSGIGDGRYSSEELTSKFLHDDRFLDARECILSTDVLIIDEIGMASLRTFEMVELVCRLAIGTDTVFGGLQVIGSGDFKQLAPVPNYRYDDVGDYCFNSDRFKSLFPHHVNLKTVVRQSEAKIINAVNELCNGSPSEETEALLIGLNNGLEDEQKRQLFGTHFDADYTNRNRLDEIEGVDAVYKAIDKAPKVLSLKVGSPVILLRNIAPGLQNGTLGNVVSLNVGGPPTVDLNGRLLQIESHEFQIYDPKQQQIIASRQQIPLRLAYALTVHRAQGFSLDKVEIDCHSFFALGQMGVAVGREISSDGLRIINYNRHAARLKHKECVYMFYASTGNLEFEDNLTCCRNHQISVTQYENVPTSLPQVAPTRDIPTQGVASTSGEGSCPFHIDDFVNTCTGKTFMPQSISENLSSVLQEHTNYLYARIKPFFSENLKTGDDFVTFYKHVNNFFN